MVLKEQQAQIQTIYKGQDPEMLDSADPLRVNNLQIAAVVYEKVFKQKEANVADLEVIDDRLMPEQRYIIELFKHITPDLEDVHEFIRLLRQYPQITYPISVQPIPEGPIIPLLFEDILEEWERNILLATQAGLLSDKAQMNMLADTAAKYAQYERSNGNGDSICTTAYGRQIAQQTVFADELERLFEIRSDQV